MSLVFHSVLSPYMSLVSIIFSVHINDLFYHIKQANLNSYADDQQLYSSDKNLETLNTRLEHKLEIADSRNERNGMIVNPHKHQAMAIFKCKKMTKVRD